MSEWINVKDRLPELAGYPVLVYAFNQFLQFRIIKAFTSYDFPVRFLSSEWEHEDMSKWVVTHWCELPQSPESEGTE